MADVLIIDDDIDSTGVLAEVMRIEGHDVRIGYNGRDGLRLARERIPEVALLDVEMPILDGLGMAHEMLLRDMGLEKVPVVLVSGVPNLSDVAARLGTPYFLGKPYRYQQVVALVNRALSEGVARQPRHQSVLVNGYPAISRCSARPQLEKLCEIPGLTACPEPALAYGADFRSRMPAD